MRNCMRCGVRINEWGAGNRIKTVGKEGYWSWILRHIRQLFSLIAHGFIKPEIEGYIELCDACFKDFMAIFGYWMGSERERFETALNDKSSYG